jgi:hypothetical protein
MKILLGDCNEKVGGENIFKPTIGNESLHQGSNDDGVGIVIDYYAVLAGFGTSGVKSAGRICGHVVSSIREKSMLSPSPCPSVCPCVSTRPPLVDVFS